MEWVPQSFAIGIRHKKIFTFLSHAGMVTDSILALQGEGPFPKSILKKIAWPNPLTVRMHDKAETLVFECSVDGVLLTVDLEELEWTRENAKTAILMAADVLMLYGGDKAINRIGMVDNYSFEHGERSAKLAVEALTKFTALGDPKDLALRIAFRSPTEEGLLSGGANDWRNTIIQVRTGKEDLDSEEDEPEKVFINLDIQTYFEPERKYAKSLVDNHYDWVTRRLAKIQAGELSAFELVEAASR